MNKILRFSELKQGVGLSRSTVWRLEQLGSFPSRIQISALHRVEWYQSLAQEKWWDGKTKLIPLSWLTQEPPILDAVR